MGNCAGIDWASEKHDVLIEDSAGHELLAATFAHDEAGVTALCAALVCFEVEVSAIEGPMGCWSTGDGDGGAGVGVAPQTRQGRAGPLSRVGGKSIGLTGS
jgi:hypothetical protein